MANLDQIMDYLADSETVQTIQPSLTVTTGETISASAYKCGHIVHLTIVAKRAAQTAAGSNMYTATLNNTELLPLGSVTTAAYYSGIPVGLSISSTGSITFRVLGTQAMSSGWSVTIGVSYLVA